MISENMEYRRLAGTSLDVSVVSLGSIGFMRGGLDADEIAAVTNRALDLGINFIDTAYAYGGGEVETALGPVMEERRDECFILTRSHLREADAVRESMEGSFERLRTDYIDVFQFHDVGTEAMLEQLLTNGVYDVVREAVEAGRIGYAGISTHGPLDLVRKMITCGRFSVMTVAHNLTGTKRSEGDGEFLGDTASAVFPLAHEHGVGITIMKPFGGGVLCQPTPDGARLSPVKCLLYAMADPFVATVSPGVDSLEQLEEDATAGRPDLQLTDEERVELEQEGLRWGEFFCRQCRYCLPCSEDIAIPKVMKLLETRRSADAGSKAAEAAEKAYGDLAVKPSDCIACGDCEARCPYGFPVAERMSEAAQLFEPATQ